MKKLIALSFFCFSIGFVKSQNVTNVSWEIKDDWVNIYYSMPDFTDRFLVNVSVWCSIDGGNRFLIKKAGGDIGRNVRGGKQRYKVAWQRKKPLKNPRFYVEAVLVKIDSERPIDGKVYVGYNGSFGFEDQSAGFRIGHFKKLGGYGAFSIDPNDNSVGTVTGGLTVGLFQKNWGGLYAYGGVGIGDFFDEFTMESGMIFSVYGVSIALGSNIEFGVFESNLVAGFGFMF